MDQAAREQQRELALEIGVAGRLLLSGAIDKVLPLDDGQALEAAGPIRQGNGIRFDSAKIEARRKAMIRRLPAQGMVLVVLGGSHDLGPHVPATTGYLRITPNSYPE
jgi:hypothetical protein